MEGIETANRQSRARNTEQLVRDVAQGDVDALRALYDSYSSGIYCLALRRLADKGMAEEVVQDVFLKVWHAAAAWDPARGSFEAWLFTLARNAVYDRLREIPRERFFGLDDEMVARVEDSGAELEHVMDIDSVQSLVQDLPPEQREVVLRIYVEGMTTADVSRDMKIPIGTVKSRIRLAIERLRRNLPAREVES